MKEISYCLGIFFKPQCLGTFLLIKVIFISSFSFVSLYIFILSWLKPWVDFGCKPLSIEANGNLLSLSSSEPIYVFTAGHRIRGLCHLGKIDIMMMMTFYPKGVKSYYPNNMVFKTPWLTMRHHFVLLPPANNYLSNLKLQILQ